jgi:hypothetical protein
MSSQITMNCDIEMYLINTYQSLINVYCHSPKVVEGNESCIKLMYNLWLSKLNYNRFCLNT